MDNSEHGTSYRPEGEKGIVGLEMFKGICTENSFYSILTVQFGQNIRE